MADIIRMCVQVELKTATIDMCTRDVKLGHLISLSDVMTISDLAEYLQVSKSFLYKLVQQGKVPGQKAGKHWRFSRAVIDGWLVNDPHTHVKSN